MNINCDLFSITIINSILHITKISIFDLYSLYIY